MNKFCKEEGMEGNGQATNGNGCTQYSTKFLHGLCQYLGKPIKCY